MNNYFFCLLHPFKANQKALLQRQQDHKSIERDVDFFEGILYVWMLIILKSIFFFVAFHLTQEMANSTTVQMNSLDLFFSKNRFFSLFLILFFVLRIALFPFVVGFSNLFWYYIFKMYAGMIGKVDRFSMSINSILTISNTAYFYKVVPIFGELLFTIGRLVSLFAGLKENLGLSTGRSMLAIVLPLILFGSMVLFGGTLIVLITSISFRAFI